MKSKTSSLIQCHFCGSDELTVSEDSTAVTHTCNNCGSSHYFKKANNAELKIVEGKKVEEDL
jgi:hypothetical protein